MRAAQGAFTRIRGLVAAEFGLAPADIAGPTRGPPAAAFARQIAMYLAVVDLGFTQTAVAAAADRDRTTVCHALKHVEDLRDDAAFDLRLFNLESRVTRAFGALPPLPPAGVDLAHRSVAA